MCNKLNTIRVSPLETVESGMELVCECVGYRELSNEERLLVALSGERFTFIHFDGVLKINRALPKLKALEKAARALWQIDRLPDDMWDEELERICDEITRIAGTGAAVQLHKEWSWVRSKRLEAQKRAAAKAWLEARDLTDYLDHICDTTGGYDPGFIDALWAESHSSNALFAYGYQMGLEAAARAAAV